MRFPLEESDCFGDGQMIDALLPCGIHDTNIVFGLLMGGAPLHNMFARVYRRLSATRKPTRDECAKHGVTRIPKSVTRVPGTRIQSCPGCMWEIHLNPGLVTHVLRAQVACL